MGGLALGYPQSDGSSAMLAEDRAAFLMRHVDKGGPCAVSTSAGSPPVFVGSIGHRGAPRLRWRGVQWTSAISPVGSSPDSGPPLVCAGKVKACPHACHVLLDVRLPTRGQFVEDVERSQLVEEVERLHRTDWHSLYPAGSTSGSGSAI